MDLLNNQESGNIINHQSQEIMPKKNRIVVSIGSTAASMIFLAASLVV